MAKAQTATARAPSRVITLDSIRSGKRQEPDKLLLFGTEGVGKSTFSASAPSPIFIAAEDGLSELDVKSFPEPESFDDVLACIRLLRNESHDFKTLVIDTVDWLEPVLWDSLCRTNNWQSIESPGYGKGYVAATDSWRRLLVELDGVRADKGMEIHLLAHAAIKPFQNPAGDDYARYEMKLHRGAAALLKEWAKAVLFAVHEEFTEKESAKSRAKGVSTGRRVVHTTRCAAWDAKNRYGLPATLPLSYQDYADARARGQVASPATLDAEARALLAELAPDEETHLKIQGSIQNAKNNASRLAQIVDRLRTLVAEKED